MMMVYASIPSLSLLILITFLGQWKADIPIPQNMSLDRSEENLEGKRKEEFLEFIRGMLQWRPEDRKTAKQLLDDPWLKTYVMG